MPLTLPILDDRTYSDLVEEALSMIPRYAPSWTNHNPSDPGITLIELLAYFTEILLYRLDRISRENKFEFLMLLLGSGNVYEEQLDNLSIDEIDEIIRDTVVKLRDQQRAVTCHDYEYLAKQAIVKHFADIGDIRVVCVVGRNLESSGSARKINLPGHLSVVLISAKAFTDKDYDPLIEVVRDYLEPRRLLTTRLHVVKPCYLWFTVGAMIYLRSDTDWTEIRKLAMDKLNQYFNPFSGGGPDKNGWPFGRNLYLSEIYDILDRLPGVAYVENVRVLSLSFIEENLEEIDQSAVGVQIGIHSTVGVTSRIGTVLSTNGKRLIRNDMGQLIGVALNRYELLKMNDCDEHLQKGVTIAQGSGDFEGEY